MANTKNEYAIETILLTKIFPDWWGRAKVVAVEDLDLKISYNQIYGLLGPNGSGKTTTLKMLLNLLYPTKGKAVVLGGSVDDPRISKRIGYLPEESYLYRYLSARETLDFYGRIFDLPSKIRNQRIDALLDMVGLSGMANRPVGTFSKGMARRIGLAQALINDPDLLILDEPTSGMDPIGNRQIKELLKKLAQRGKTILLCSHLLADVEDVCDRIGILYGGRMQIEGRVGSLLQHTEQNQITTDSISQTSMNKIREILSSENVSFNVTSPMDRLEDFFIKIVTGAQKARMATSGAVSTIRIDGFLAEESVTENILDKLVSASVQSKPVPSGDVETEKVHSEAVPQPDADKNLLEKLTAPGNQPRSVDTRLTEPVAPPAASQESVKRNILDELLKNQPDARTEPVDKSTEDKDE